MALTAGLNDLPDDEGILRSIRESGWKRGEMFRHDGLHPQAYAIGPNGPGRILPFPPQQEQSGLWVVTSQTCDLVAPLDKEPYVSACPCAVEADQGARARLRRTYRGFEIDPVKHVVVDVTRPILLAKYSLLHVGREPWPGTPRLLARFEKWLGQRVSRQAIPDEIDWPALRPLRTILDDLRTGSQRKREMFHAFNDIVREVRIWPPRTEDPPFTIDVVLILKEDRSKAADDAIQHVLSKWRAKTDRSKAIIGEVRELTPARISLAEVDTTWQVDLLTDSYDGDRQVGAPPIQH